MKYFAILLTLLVLPAIIPTALAIPQITSEESTLKFIDFSYTHTVGVPIQFILEKTRDTNCNSYDAKITDENENFILGWGEEISCDPDSVPNSVQTKIGYKENKPIIINKSGKYYLEVVFDDATIKREFVVKQNHSGGSLDRLVYPVLWTIESPLKQLYSGISPDKVTCKADLELVQKTNGLVACVAFDTKEKLIQRNWAADFPMKHIIDSTYWAKTYLVHHTMCAHIGVWEQTEKDTPAWNMTDTDLEKIPIIKSMIEYNSHGLYSSSEYPRTSTIVSDEIQNQHRQNFNNIANSKSDHGSTFWYNGKYYYTDFAIC